MQDKHYDAIVIGSGFGGAMTAKKLVDKGWNVAIIERGRAVKRGPENWGRNASVDLTSHYDKSQPYHVEKGGNKPKMGSYTAVGGPSIFYGGVSFRFREEDFSPPTEIVGDSKAAWPIRYEDLAPYYDEAEDILQISGEAGVDPTEPTRVKAFPQGAPQLADVSQRIKTAAESMGLRPFRLPMAINYEDKSRTICQRCTTCDTFACAVGAKNDIATMVIPQLVERSATVYPSTIVHHLEYIDGRIAAVHCTDLASNTKHQLSADVVVLAAGAMGSPHLLLSSKLEQYNPAGDAVGRYLMRHANAIIFGIFPTPPDKQGIFHKELAILDYYFGTTEGEWKGRKLGSLQSISTPPPGLVEMEAPRPLGKVAALGVKLLTGLLAIAEDQPQYANHITVDHTRTTAYGMATPVVSSDYSERDIAAVTALANEAKKIMKKTGAWTQYIHHIRTFSHTVGTIRMGDDQATAPLDRNCNYRGIDNLYVTDGSFMPTSAAVNPSLTISANALRVGDYILKTHLR